MLKEKPMLQDKHKLKEQQAMTSINGDGLCVF
ncbi:Uncharacterised protein [Yersinia mollaretii]|nr:Uncharacterised protein [Yersinia mollaretii]CQH36383.1 Uncharacterised protein [Yersinia mollaretii]